MAGNKDAKETSRSPISLVVAAIATGATGNLAYEWWSHGKIRGVMVIGTVVGVLVMTAVMIAVFRRACAPE